MTVSTASSSSAGDIHDPTSSAYKKARRKHWKSTRNRPEHVDADWTPFRAAEKQYKARFPPPDLSSVLDLAAADPSRAEETARSGWWGRADAVECTEIPLDEGTEDRGGRKAYIFPGTPGLVLLPSFVPHKEQRKLVRWVLHDHARSPNETNLDTHYVLPEEGIWKEYLRIRKGEIEDAEVIPRAALQPTTPEPEATPSTSDSEHTQTQEDAPGPRQLISNKAASPNNYTALARTLKLPAPPSQTLHPVPTSSLVSKLRWANIGWYYHWGTKQYDFTRGPGEIAELVRRVCRRAVEKVPWEIVFSGEDGKQGWSESGPDWMHWKETYEPDAGIVNFYQTKDTLMAHVDRSEICATSPLVSISLGCAAVFLIGGLTRDDPPTPILLRSGDIVIMSGPACRRAYHGVPRILEGTLPPHLEGGDDEDWEYYEEYLRGTRINVNVRQVFPKGFNPVLLNEERK